jgi:putative DNA primase/helicase
LANEHKIPIFWGQGRNGKDTLLGAVKGVLGVGLAAPVSPDVLMDGNRAMGAGAASPHLYALRGLKLAWVSETRAGGKINLDQAKNLSGGGDITARPLHGNPVVFSPKFTLLMLTNHKPAIGDDYAMWQRVLLVPFTQSFVDNPIGENERQVDRGLKQQLAGETSGILAWLVRGCLEYQAMGLKPPVAVVAATENYRAEDDMPAGWGEFEADCLEFDGDGRITGGALFDAYYTYVMAAGGVPSSKNKVGVYAKKYFTVISKNPVVLYGGVKIGRK